MGCLSLVKTLRHRRRLAANSTLGKFVGSPPFPLQPVDAVGYGTPSTHLSSVGIYGAPGITEGKLGGEAVPLVWHRWAIFQPRPVGIGHLGAEGAGSVGASVPRKSADRSGAGTGHSTGSLSPRGLWERPMLLSSHPHF